MPRAQNRNRHVPEAGSLRIGGHGLPKLRTSIAFDLRQYPGSLPRPITLPGGHPLLQIGTRSLDSDHNQLINHRSLATEQQRCPRFGMGSYTFAPASFRASLTGLPFLLPEGSTRWPLRPDGPDGSRFLPAAMIAPALTPLSARWCCVRGASRRRAIVMLCER